MNTAVLPVTWVRCKTAMLETYVGTWASEARRIRQRDRNKQPRGAVRPNRDHEAAAIDWLCHAHDIGGDGGVPALYSLVEGWMGSYPETTGYIVPTLLNISRLRKCDDLRDRALRMTDWLLMLQNGDGSFPGSFVGRLGGPRVFNTGQILFGLLAGYAETEDRRLLEAVEQAGEWLLDVQSPDGAWRKAELHDVAHVYNVRTAWALAVLGEVTKKAEYSAAAIRNGEWATARQAANGWYFDNAFEPGAELANLHTIAYAMQGLLELGLLIDRQDFVKSAQTAGDALLDLWRHGEMPGAFRPDWSRGADWRCLPGEAQLAVVWQRIGQVTGKEHYRSAAIELIDGLKSAQMWNSLNPSLHGGLSGSYPINGAYERYCLVNWGPKFLLDALMLAEVMAPSDANPSARMFAG